MKKTPSKVAQNSSNPLFSLTASTAQMAQTEEIIFQNVAYWPTVYRTGDKVKNFCDHCMILWEMAGDLLTSRSFWPPPHPLGLTEAGAYPQLPTQPKFFWSFSNLYSNLLWSFWVVSRRKIKIWIWGKKVQFITESCILRQKRLQISLFSKKLNFFSLNSNFDFSLRDN